MTVHHLETILAGLCLLPLCACASGAKSSEAAEPPEAETYVPIPRAEPKPIGVLLADLDWTIQEWNRLVMTADTDDQRRRAAALERNLADRSRRRMSELVLQLETGPPNNRIVAAAALGFTGATEALSPLLAALDDREPRVVGNALLGLAVLASPDTPQGPLVRLTGSPDATIRTMAFYAARAVTAEAEASPGLLRSAESHLSDADPFVRTQAVLLVAQAGHSAALGELADLLFDPERLVRSAAAKGLAAMGRENPRDLAPAARALTRALDRADRSDRMRLFAALGSLGRSNFGTDAEKWVEWANGLQ